LKLRRRGYPQISQINTDWRTLRKRQRLRNQKEEEVKAEGKNRSWVFLNLYLSLNLPQG
jgi:hypothetical protein